MSQLTQQLVAEPFLFDAFDISWVLLHPNKGVVAKYWQLDKLGVAAPVTINDVAALAGGAAGEVQAFWSACVQNGGAGSPRAAWRVNLPAGNLVGEKRPYQLALAWRQTDSFSGVACWIGPVECLGDRTVARDLESLERLAQTGEMAAGIAHEFNNILTAMMGWTQLAVRLCDGNKGALQALATIEHNSQRARHIAAELLEVARPSHAEPQGKVEVGAAVNEALKLLNWDLSKANVSVSCDIQSGRSSICNMSRLVQVFVNVIRNAIDAMPNGGTIDVLVADKGPNVMAVFSDSGSGISQTALKEAFTPFFTTKAAGDDKFGGSGLGLSVSRKIIEEAAGQISLINGPSGGAVVTISLPAVSAEELPAVSQAPTSSSLPPGVAVLVVDDEPDICEMIKTALHLKGAHVVSTTSGDDALALAQKERFNAAFVDFAMNGLSGHNLGRALFEVQPGLPITYMSGASIPCDGSGEQIRFLKKPFDLSEIQTCLNQMLELSNAGMTGS